MANPMMASHGCGQRIGFGRWLGWSAMVALGLSGVPGQARASRICPSNAKVTIHHIVAGAATISPVGGNSSPVHSAQILNPTSLVPLVPPLTPTTAPTITATAVLIPTMTAPTTALTPSPMANPAAAATIVASAPPVVSAWHDAGTLASTSACSPPPPSHVPVTAPPAADQSLNPPAPLLAPAATNTPEPSTIVSALVMVGVATLWRRRGR